MEKFALLLSILLGINKIDGYVYDKNTGESLCGVKITTLKDTVYTDLNGYFVLENIQDTTNISFDFISYEKKDTTIINDKSLTIRIK